MKITYLYQYFGTPKGSWSTRVYELTKRWVELGHEVTVVTAPYDKSDIEAKGFVSVQQIEGINLIVIDASDSNRMAKWRRVLNALQFSIIASYYTIRLKSDVIIASSGPITIGLPGLLGKWIRSVPLVFEVRDLWPDGGIEMGIIKGLLVKNIAKKFESLLYNSSELIVPCSLGMEKSICSRFSATKTLVIPNASDVDLFQAESQLEFEFPEWLKTDTKLFLYTGSLGLMDSCIEIIDGFGGLNTYDHVHLVFLGDGAERNVLQQKVKDLSLEENIHFMGLVQKHEVVAWYKKAIASFVVFKNYPVLSTSSPNKMFDSFAAGVPIIQNTVGWIKDLVEKENCGINVIPNDPVSMTQAIQVIIQDNNLQLSMAQNAFRLAETAFNRDLLAKEYLDVLINIVDN